MGEYAGLTQSVSDPHGRLRMSQANARHNWASLDQAELTALLPERHADLLARRDALLAAMARVPDPLDTPDAVARAQKFAVLLRAARNGADTTRKDDKQPFIAAGKHVEAFFKSVIAPLDEALRELQHRLTDARLVAIEQAVPSAIPTPEAPPPSAATPVIDSTSIEAVTTVVAIDRAALDMEALRDVFTDRELMDAVQRHLRRHGPTLAGVAYHDVARV
jgi:hypothetical protein